MSLREPGGRPDGSVGLSVGLNRAWRSLRRSRHGRPGAPREVELGGVVEDVGSMHNFPTVLEAGRVRAVKGHWDLPGGGQETCPVAVTRIARWWPWDLPCGGHHGRGYGRGLTPWPARAWVRRTLSPLVWQTCAWCSSRSTVAVARVLGMSSSNPAGCRLEEMAIERFS